MTQDLHLALKINVDKKDGESNLSAFNRAFKAALTDIGKNAEELARATFFESVLRWAKQNLPGIKDGGGGRDTEHKRATHHGKAARAR